MLRLSTDLKHRESIGQKSGPEPPINYAGAYESVCEEIFRHPSVFGRMVGIVLLFDAQTGRYSHRLSERFGIEEIDQVLRRLHSEIFISWLSLPLRQQHADVAVYLATLGGRGQPLDLQALGRQCIPAAAIAAERDLFLQDLALIDALHRYDFELA